MRPPDPPLMPNLPEPFFWEILRDRDWGPYWQVLARLPEPVQFAEVHCRRRGWVAIVGLYRRAPRPVPVGPLPQTAEHVRAWLQKHGVRAIEEAKSSRMMRNFPTAPLA
ncbi:hypothetical protein GCM10008101_08360 [Lysobacter xinjiangensis]|uniref:Uncharacterized protein n=1 Tax=Cognatilysobacter xinjiangensis TaxID=546892 RepID=A0ABQ3BXH9_9GAMM|nr:hypothetical protein GCM10008101_08360 [Lysobacter xinjiangensis]